MSKTIEKFDERLAPSRLWYLLAVAVAIGGFVAMGAFMVPRIAKLSDSSQQVLVPGVAEITLPEPGTYIVYHESRSVLNGQVFHTPSISGMRLSLAPAEGGAPLTLTPSAANIKYSLGSREGASIFSFELDKPGRYRLNAAYGDGRAEPRAVLAIGKDFLPMLLTTIFGSIGLAFGGIALAGVITYSVTHRRRTTRHV